MNLTLTSDDLVRSSAVSRVLLAPLEAASVDAWRAEVLGAMRALLGSDVGMFMLSTAPAVHYSESMDKDFLLAYDRWLEEASAAGVRLGDPVIWRWLNERRRCRQDVFDNEAVNALLSPFGMRLEASAVYAEGMGRSGIRQQNSMFCSFSGGEAMLQCGFRRAGGGPLGSSALPLLSALLPSFRAGLDAVTRLAAHRAALDAVPQPLAAFDADGRERHRNGALVALLDAEPERATVEAELRYLARGVRRLGYPLRQDRLSAPPAAERAVATRRGRYTLRGALLPAGAFGPGEAFLVSVEAEVRPAPPSPEALQARFGLTGREAEVALLLAEGARNDAIAERLFIAPGTARRHTENVLAKLGVESRAAVAARLLQGG